MAGPFRTTRSMRQLLGALLGSTGWRHGYDLSKETGLKSGTLYPLLLRLAERGWVEARWDEPEYPGRPPRHLYRLTAQGETVARDMADGIRAPAPGRLSPA
jgi:DNA-binding PadR family transcriptional regulator